MSGRGGGGGYHVSSKRYKAIILILRLLDLKSAKCFTPVRLSCSTGVASQKIMCFIRRSATPEVPIAKKSLFFVVVGFRPGSPGPLDDLCLVALVSLSFVLLSANIGHRLAAAWRRRQCCIALSVIPSAFGNNRPQLPKRVVFFWAGVAGRRWW